MLRRMMPSSADSLIAAGELHVARRSAVRSSVILTAALWVIPIGYCLYLMVLLDIALPGRSAESLAGLVGMAAVLVIFHALLSGIRQQTLSAFCGACDAAGRVLHRVELDALRRALQGGGTAAVIDAASLPLLIAGLALTLGWVAAVPLLGAVISICLLIAVARTGKPWCAPDQARRARDLSAAMISAQRDHLALLRLTDRAAAVVSAHRHAAALSDAAAFRHQRRASAIVSLLAAASLAGVAGAAAWMVAQDAASMGAFAAALLLTFLIFQPLHRIAVEIGALIRAAAEWRALREALDQRPAIAPAVALPPPARDVEVAGIAVAVPGSRRLTLQDVTFRAEAGDVVAVIGPADAGKSTLLRVLAGQVPHSLGAVRLDGAALNQWSGSALCRHIGYVPQIPTLMPGSVAENIAGFVPAVDPGAITRAAQAAGAHEAIVRLPFGYDTIIGDPDQPAPALSVQQRIAWARALYGDPFLVLLDNPGSFQDHDGHGALARCLATLRARGAVTVVVGDSASVIDSANLVLVLRKGAVVDFGRKEDVRARMAERQRREAERLAEMSVCADPRGGAIDASLVE